MLPFFVKVHGAIAKRLGTGLQIRLAQFDSGSRLHMKQRLSPPREGFFVSQQGLVQHLSFKVSAWILIASAEPPMTYPPSLDSKASAIS